MRYRYRYNFPKTIKLKIDGFPPKNSTKTNWFNVFSFCTGILLAVSESLPFIDTKYNGILHMFSKIQQEYKGNFK